MAHQQPAGEAGTPSSPAGFLARWGAIQAALQRINVLQEWTAVAGGVPGKLVDSRGVARLCKRLRELADVLAQIASIDKAGSGTAAAGVFDAEDQAAYCAAAGFNFARAELLAQARETVSQPEGALDTALRFDIVSSCLKSIKHAMSRHSLVDAALLPLIVLATRSQEARASIAAEDAGDMLRKVLKVHAGNHHIVFSAVKLARLLVTSSLSRQAQLLDAKVLPQVVRVLEKHLDVSNIQAEGMRFMGNFAADAGDMRDAALQVGGVKAVLAAMEAHTADAQVMEWACGALANISSGNRTAQEQVASLPIIATLCEASRYYKAHPGILEAACAALANLTLLMPENQIEACRHGAGLSLVRVLHENLDRDGVVHAACLALANCLCDDLYRRDALEADVLSTILHLMDKHAGSPSMLAAVLSLVFRMGYSPEFKDAAHTAALVPAILTTLRKATLHAGVQEKGMAALSTLCSNSRRNKDDFLACDGASAVVDALDAHPADESVACAALGSLQFYASTLDKPLKARCHDLALLPRVQRAVAAFPGSTLLSDVVGKVLTDMFDVLEADQAAVMAAAPDTAAITRTQALVRRPVPMGALAPRRQPAGTATARRAASAGAAPGSVRLVHSPVPRRRSPPRAATASMAEASEDGLFEDGV